jgi:membrane protein
LTKANIKEFIKKSKIARKAVQWGKKQSLPGFQGIALYDILKFVFKELNSSPIFAHANSIAFSFLIAIVPLFLVVLTMIAYLPVGGLTEEMLELIQRFSPSKTQNFIQDTLNEVLTIQRSDLMSIGFLLTIFFASNGMVAMMSAFDKKYEESFKRRNFLKRRMISIGLTLLLLTIMIMSLAFIVGSRHLLQWIFDLAGFGSGEFLLLQIIKWIILVFLLYSVIASIYYFGPALRKKLRFWSPGATFATLASIVSSGLFSLYISNFSTYNTFYGSLGAIIILMIWIQINCLVILLGFEINAGIAVSRDRRNLA